MATCGLGEEELSHKDLVGKYNELVSELTEDPLLFEVSPDDTVMDVQGLLALAQGKAIAIHIKRFDGEVVCEWPCVCSEPLPQELSV